MQGTAFQIVINVMILLNHAFADNTFIPFFETLYSCLSVHLTIQ